MRLHVKKVRTDEEDAEISFVLYWEGELARPVAIISEMEMRRLLRDLAEQGIGRSDLPPHSGKGETDD